MHNDTIVLFEPIPALKSKGCRFVSFLLKLFLQYTVWVLPLGMWYRYDLFIAFLSLVLTFILMGILRSKLRNDAVPFNQREFHYNDTQIADWFLAKRVCFQAQATDENGSAL